MNTGIRFSVNALLDLLLIVSVLLIAREKVIQEQTQNPQPIILKRKDFPKSIQQKILFRQGYRCNSCQNPLNGIQDFHHKNGNRADNNSWNCEALCPNCHARKTRNG